MSDNNSQNVGGCEAFTSGALANGTNAGTIKTTATITFTIDGEFKSKSATDNLSIAVTGSDAYGDPGNGSFTGADGGSTRLYGLYLNASGTLSVVAGPIVNTAELAAGTASLQQPTPQLDKACIGSVRIAVTAGTSFIPGTTALDASGVTTTYVNRSKPGANPIRS